MGLGATPSIPFDVRFTSENGRQVMSRSDFRLGGRRGFKGKYPPAKLARQVRCSQVVQHHAHTGKYRSRLYSPTVTTFGAAAVNADFSLFSESSMTRPAVGAGRGVRALTYKSPAPVYWTPASRRCAPRKRRCYSDSLNNAARIGASEIPMTPLNG